jgi:hypothetical protein
MHVYRDANTRSEKSVNIEGVKEPGKTAADGKILEAEISRLAFGRQVLVRVALVFCVSALAQNGHQLSSLEHLHLRGGISKTTSTSMMCELSEEFSKLLI